MTTLSVIIPCWNREIIVRETLNSVLAQTRSDWECILVDDHSTDGTFDVLQGYAEKEARFRVFRRPDDHLKGPSACRNFGMEQATGKMITFIDSDDLLDPGYLQFVADAFNSDDGKDANCLLMRTDHFVDDPASPIYTSPLCGKSGADLMEDILSYRIVDNWNAGFTWKTSFLRNSGIRYNEKMRQLEDIDFAYRLICRASKCAYVRHKPLVHLRKCQSDHLSATTTDRDEGLVMQRFALFKNLYGECRRHKKLTPSVNRRLMRIVLVIEISALFGNHRHMAKEIGNFIMLNAGKGLRSAIFVMAAHAILYNTWVMTAVGRFRDRIHKTLRKGSFE